MNKELTWNIVNSLLAGALVFFGGFSSGNVTSETIVLAAVAAGVAAVVQFKGYWTQVEPKHKTTKLFTFIKPI